ncbi:hypothetical protein ACIBUY_28120 [Streptomyces sp. NPDC050085]|uniref:hypothetical protein n=1 Tax=Streptomyces sp. NPDC050085 TaxID=3365600 RepID=UPI0037BDE678
MAADAPFAGHDPAIIILLAFAGLIATACLSVFVLVRAVRTLRGQHRGQTSWLRTAGLVALTGAIGMYTWGVLHLAVLDESSQAEACRRALDGKKLVAYDPTYIPLAFGCVADNGKTYDIAVPGYVTPVSGLLGIAAFLLTAFSFAEAHNDKKENVT